MGGRMLGPEIDGVIAGGVWVIGLDPVNVPNWRGLSVHVLVSIVEIVVCVSVWVVVERVRGGNGRIGGRVGKRKVIRVRADCLGRGVLFMQFSQQGVSTSWFGFKCRLW